MSIMLPPVELRTMSMTFVDEPRIWLGEWEPDGDPFAVLPEGWTQVGVVAESYDRLSFFHKKTKNRERYVGAGIRFSFDRHPNLRANRVRNALLAYVPSTRPANVLPNSSVSCKPYNQIGRVARLLQPISESVTEYVIGGTTDTKQIGMGWEIGLTGNPPHAQYDMEVDAPPEAAETSGTSSTGFDVTEIVRSWLNDPSTNHGFYVHPSPPDLTESPRRRVVANLGSGNRRRRKHWVRQPIFQIRNGSSPQYRYWCKSYIAPQLIIEA